MRKYFRLGLILSVLLSILWVLPVSAVTIDNDGKARDNPYGDSKLPSCYKNSKYWDCYLPYKMTCEEIGGYALSATATGNMVTTGGGSAMPESIRKSPVATTIMEETYHDYAVRRSWLLVKLSNPKGFNVTYEEDTGMNIVTDEKGQKYYLTAVQGFFFRHPGKGKDGFPDGSNVLYNGEVFDVILTDGTCIHFVMYDYNSDNHTNGTPTDADSAFDYSYSNSKLKYKQYNNLFSTQNGNTLEVWGRTNYLASTSGGIQCVTGFKKKYNFGSKEGQNRIAYYRMYNKFLKDSPERESGVGKDVSFSYGKVNISSSESGDKKSEKNGSNMIPKEWDILGMPDKPKFSEKSASIELTDGSDLDNSERYIVGTVNTNLSTIKESKIVDLFRVGVVFIGMCLNLYSILMLVCLIFDRVNSFLDISLVSMISFGKIKVYDVENTGERADGYTPTGKVVLYCIVMFIIGMFLISGGTVLYKLLYMIL